MALSQVTNHIEEMLLQRLEEFKKKVRFTAILEIFGQQIQELETVAFQVLEETNDIDIAVGAQLDGIGDIVGEDRAGRTDTDYRLAIRARIQLNSSRGTIEDLISLVAAVLAGATSQVIEYFPAGFALLVTSAVPSGIDPAIAGNVIREGRAGGVRGDLILHVSPPFQYDTGDGYDTGKYATAVSA